MTTFTDFQLISLKSVRSHKLFDESRYDVAVRARNWPIVAPRKFQKSCGEVFRQNHGTKLEFLNQYSYLEYLSPKEFKWPRRENNFLNFV